MSPFELFALLSGDLRRLVGSLTGARRLLAPIYLVHPRFLPVVLIRLSRFFYLTRVLSPLATLLTWFNFFVFGIECTPKCRIGAGLSLPHTSGTVIGAASIGENVTIFQGVTLGALQVDLGFDESRRPAIASNVLIGAGAKVLGGIQVGTNVTIGANAVVLQSLPADSLGVGIPAKVILKEKQG